MRSQTIDDHTLLTWKHLEKYSSAATLADMEIFVFPELLYSLVLANIMSTRLWTWRDHPWFENIERMSEAKRAVRLRQFIMDHYEFNLDLETWGLTTKDEELKRFKPWISSQTLSESNALFGYEGDRHYFDVDIRRHFGLDKYDSDVIPYWKTETIEAMDAFIHKPGFAKGAGECVSFSALYAAALFLVCRIPLSRIFLLATPLHSQNFICVDDGIITNNRRVISKSMWFNGTEQSANAKRALRHEQVTVVAHHTGYVHCAYPEASINATDYSSFSNHLTRFLSTLLTPDILVNFLRDNSRYQKFFQIKRSSQGKTFYIPAESVFAYEHNSACKFSPSSRNRLLDDIDDEDLYRTPFANRIAFDKVTECIPKQGLDLSLEENRQQVRSCVAQIIPDEEDFLSDLISFSIIRPNLPVLPHGTDENHGPTIELDSAQSRQQIVEHLESIRQKNVTADLAFYAARDLGRSSFAPFLFAALTRNPVSIDGAKSLADNEVIANIDKFVHASIYDENRIAQPDEVWNYGRGDGLERLLCIANILASRHPDAEIRLRQTGETVHLEAASYALTARTNKKLLQTVALSRRPIAPT